MNLVVMAAGMGSRFGGIKQLTPVGPSGEFLIDYSVYDAMKAGVDKVIFVIKEEHFDMFKETIGKRIESKVQVEYAFQKMDDIPEGFTVPINRVKPWGTGQALLSTKEYVDDSFMIINADDFYGRDAFKCLGEYLKKSDKDNEYAMVSYILKNTLSKNGTVSRGICISDGDKLKSITERTKIGYLNDKLVYFEDDKHYDIDENSLVSVNLFGLKSKIFKDTEKYFVDFLSDLKNPEKDEFLLPNIIQMSISDKLASVKVLNTTSNFNGMTYKEDLEGLKKYILELIEDGVYPTDLWGDNDEE